MSESDLSEPIYHVEAFSDRIEDELLSAARRPVPEDDLADQAEAFHEEAERLSRYYDLDLEVLEEEILEAFDRALEVREECKTEGIEETGPIRRLRAAISGIEILGSSDENSDEDDETEEVSLPDEVPLEESEGGSIERETESSFAAIGGGGEITFASEKDDDRVDDLERETERLAREAQLHEERERLLDRIDELIDDVLEDGELNPGLAVLEADGPVSLYELLDDGARDDLDEARELIEEVERIDRELEELREEDVDEPDEESGRGISSGDLFG